MAQDTQYSKILFNMHTASEWRETNEALLPREIGFESDTGRYKFGRGSNATPWNDLPYSSTCVFTCQVTPDDYEEVVESNGLTYYHAVIPVTGITENDIPVVDVALSSDVEAAEMQLLSFQLISQVLTANNEIHLYNYDYPPDVNFNLNLIIR